MNILVTGCAGFIGFHTCQKLIKKKYKVLGIDSLNNYYDTGLKKNRLKILKNNKSFVFFKNDLNLKFLNQKIKKFNVKIIIHLAAQAGVRYSIKNPSTYFDNNILGFFNILEASRINKINHLIFASSSSVYGNNKNIKFKENDYTDHPESFYAASKKSNEVMAYSYSKIYKIPVTGLRFFTVYGPYGRPDMAYFKFTKAIHNEEPIDVYNNGDMKRDFTYIDDIVEGIIRTIQLIPKKTSNPTSHSNAPFKIYNIGNNQPISLRRFISAIESSVGKKAIENLLPIQAGDVTTTYADIDDFTYKTGFKPETSIEVGIEKFVKWYLSEYSKKK